MSRAAGAGSIFIGALLMGAGLASWAQAPASPTQAPSIYSCIDGRGRSRTADRPIAECADREQRLLSPSGTVRATVGPSLTVQEREALEQRQRQEAEARARQVEAVRRERALLMRYPNPTVHEKERTEALAQIAAVRQAALKRVAELQRQRAALMDEMEFYRKDPTKAPPALRRQLDENDHSQAAQQRFIAEQDAERERVNARFDAERERLQPLWTMSEAPGRGR